MKATSSVCIVLIGLFTMPISFACDEPDNIVIPDGKNATADDMTAADQRYHQFMTDMQLYQVCLEDETNSDRLRSNDQSKDTITVRENKFVTLHNAASDAMKRTTKSFDQAIEDYKARQ